ncbi:hypothetical protein [Hymenobacter negativus]|uniref:Uncharacterized protein n=1 Tax=Hymenobacter negativus TaxID=2795026 RepID=A0ABS3QIN1_9BACT|nr:hypothetical protein [Hymenobacter negativus]MBO2011104.1 hypothetical protein [Hymenobacter negativus]
MPFNSHRFPVNDTYIAWGSTLAEAEALLPGHTWWEPYGGWPNLRGACQSVFGLAATECNLRAPAAHKPIMQVSYQLAALALGEWMAAVPEPWLTPLTALLGPPAEAAFTANTWHRGPGSVMYSARWRRPEVIISLSVFGGVRHEQGGPAAAGLWLDWQDEIAAARPFYEAARNQSAALQAAAGQLAGPLQVFTTQLAQGGFMMANFAAEDPYPALSNTLLRQSQRALYREGLLETPIQIQDQLTDHQIALWAVPGRAEWAVSTRWDTVLLISNGPAVELVILRPAKGSGGLTLRIGDLRLSDEYDTPGLGALAAALKQQVGLVVNRVEDYDC